MSVISIRPATERLQNLGPVRSPDRMPHFVMPDMSGQKAFARAYGDLGRGLERLGEAGMRLALDAKREDEDRRLAAAATEYQRRLQEGFLEGDNPLMARNGDALEGEGMKQTQGDVEQLFTSAFNDACTNHGIDGELKERFTRHVAPVALSWGGRMNSHVMAERQKNKIATADALVATDESGWAGDKLNAGLTKNLLDDYDHKLEVRGVTEDVRKLEVRKYALGLAADIAQSSLSGLDSEAAFDEAIRSMKENPDGIYGGNAELQERLGKDALPKKTVDLLIEEAKAQKERFVRDQTRAMAAEVDALILEGNLKDMEARLDELKKETKPAEGEEESVKKGGMVRKAKLQAAARLDKAADEIAKRLEWDNILDAAASGMKHEPPKGTRMAKFHPALKASYDEQAARWAAGAFAAEDAANREMRQSTEAVLRTQMLVAAQLNPGGFSAQLADAAAKGHISLDQYRKMRDEFSDVWRKEGMPQKAAALVNVLKREFFADKDYDLGERLGVNPKTGMFEYGKNPDTKKPFEGEDVEYKSLVFVPYSPNDWFGFRDFLFPGDRAPHYETQTRMLTSADQITLLNRALELAQHDGDETYIDPLTNETLASPRKIDAVGEFQRLCSMLKAKKRTEGAAFAVEQVCDAMLAVGAGWRGFENKAIADAEKREAGETKAREAARQIRRGSFTPKMPNARRSGLQSAETEDTED